MMDRPSLELLIGKENLVGAEIRVLRGQNAKEILDNLSIEKLYLIDNWKHKKGGYHIAEKHLRGHEDKIVWLLGQSEKVVKNIKDKELDFVYVDGDHTEIQVALDLKMYYPKVKDGGLLCGHDYQEGKPIGVNLAVDKFFKKLGLKVHSGQVSKGSRHLDWWVWKN
jgi:hypothetical protein